MVVSLLRLVILVGFLATPSGPALAARFLVVGADAGGGPHVILRADLDRNGTFETVTDSFYAFPTASPAAPLFAGGVRVAAGDFDGDGNEELVTAMGPGGSVVRIWRLTAGGRVAGLLEEFAPFGPFQGGIFVAAGDFDADGRADLVTAADAGGGPHVIVWRDANRNGRLADDAPLASFFPYVTSFAGGVRVAVGAVDGVIPPELITAPGPGGGPHVRIFEFVGGSFTPVDEFFAYNPAFTGGVYVAAGSITGTNRAQVVTGAGPGGGPHVRIFRDVDLDGQVSDDPVFDEFLAYDPGFTGGVRVAVKALNLAEPPPNAVITAPGPGGGPHIRMLADSSDPGGLLSDNPAFDEFFAFDPAFTGGAFLAFATVRFSTFAATGLPLTIPDQATPGDPLDVLLCLPPGSGIVRGLSVDLAISHTSNDHLDVTLTHLPSAAAAVLFTDVGNNDDGFIIRLNDLATLDIGLAPPDSPTDAPVVGTFTLEGTSFLSVFNGVDAAGCWRLTVNDDTAGQTGRLWGWSLHFLH
jgi:hypothetical protein